MLTPDAQRSETLAGLSRFVGRGDGYLQASVMQSVRTALPGTYVICCHLRIEP